MVSQISKIELGINARQKLTGEVIDLQCGVECACIGTTVVDGNAGSHDTGLAQTSVDISNGRSNLVQGILGACVGILLGPVYGNLAVQVNTLRHTR